MMSGPTKVTRVSAAELYGAAAMLGIERLTEIPRPDAVDLTAPETRGWAEEEFDGNTRLVPDVMGYIELCARPERFCEFSLYKRESREEYKIYIRHDAALRLRVDAEGFVLENGDAAELLAFLENAIPAADVTVEALTMPQDRATEYFADADCVALLAVADLTAEADAGEIEARNWISVYRNGALWLVEDTGGDVAARILDKAALRAELADMLTVKEG